jgi:hypothetical protein
MKRVTKYLSAVLSKGTSRMQKKKKSPVTPHPFPRTDGWIIFMKINILCCNFNEN